MDPATWAAYGVASALAFGLNVESNPPQLYFKQDQTVEVLYKEDGRIVSNPVTNVLAIDAACPNGSQTVRQTSRHDGTREYMVWVLRCRGSGWLR